MTCRWQPRFACPACHGPVDRDGERFVCVPCARSYVVQDRIWRFLLPEQRARVEPFLCQYRSVRERDGYRPAHADYYQALPNVGPDDPEAAAWRVRRTSHATFERLLETPLRRSLTVLDLGAGNGWLSNRLAQQGHHAVAVDLLDDDADGLGATRHYGVPLTCVQADFNALPFERAQFDAIVYNGSLHYSDNVAATLREAYRVLAPGGWIAVIDSPFFRRTDEGQKMVADKTRRFADEYGLRDVVTCGLGFVTFDDLDLIAASLRLRPRFHRTRGPLGWQLRRLAGGLRRRRHPAAFGVWVAR